MRQRGVAIGEEYRGKGIHVHVCGYFLLQTNV
jgi:hypothetical protein